MAHSQMLVFLRKLFNTDLTSYSHKSLNHIKVLSKEYTSVGAMAAIFFKWIFINLVLPYISAEELFNENIYRNSSNADTHVTRLFRRYWNWRLLNAPEFATLIGVYKYDDRLDEMSLSSYARRKDEMANWLNNVKELTSVSKKHKLSPTAALHLRVLRSELENYLEGLEFATHVWPINVMEGPQTDFPNLIDAMKMDTISDVEKIIKRMRLFPQQIQETVSLMSEGIRLGRTMHKVSIERLPNVLTNMATQPVNASRLFKRFLKRPSSIPEKVWYVLVKKARWAMKKKVQPSYKHLSDFITRRYLKHTRSGIGLSSLPNGRRYYAACLKFHTTLDVSAGEVHAIGLREVKRITRRMISVMKKLNYNGTLANFRQFMETSTKFSFKTGEEILKHYKNIFQRVSPVLPRYFEKLPKTNFIITPMPADIAKTFTGAYYDPPPKDQSRPGKFNINLSRPRDMKKYDAVALALHETMPGHHLQISLTVESKSLPDFLRFVDYRKMYEIPAHFITSTSYVEGWGLYAEYLGEEMGMYDNLYELYGRLSHEMLRACRLVVDTGMHALGWSREKAIKYMQQNVASPLHTCRSEVDRYISMPGQACAYKIGELKIKELRKRAERELGTKFDIRKFHNAVLSTGGVPLKILQEEIEQFITKHK